MLVLTDIEARILGCLIEKAATTPYNYPLTVNGLKNACNQTSSRQPIMNLEEGLILHNIRDMEKKNWLFIDEFGRALKCRHRFDKILNVKATDLSVIAILLLRQAQTFNQIHTRVERIYKFKNAEELQKTINYLIEHDDKFIIQLPKTKNEREHRYMHQLCGEIDLSKIAELKAKSNISPLEKRIENLEEQVNNLAIKIDDMLDSTT